MKTERRLNDFRGTWHLRKVIAHRGGGAAQFDGTAVWSAEGSGLLYQENGTLQIEGQVPVQAQRRYRWTEDLRVYFDDGRFFHDVPAAGGTARHDCAPDVYHVTYDFLQWPVFTATWTVTGPRKDYEMHCRYERISD